MIRQLLFIFLFLSCLPILAQTRESFKDCEALLQNDTLRISNDKITCTFLWNQGNLSHLGLQSSRKETYKVHFAGITPSFRLPHASFLRHQSLDMYQREKSIQHPAHLALELVNEHEDLLVKKIIRIFPQTAAITLETHLKYKTLLPPSANDEILQIDGTEDFFYRGQVGNEVALEQFDLQLPHWRFSAVAFRDVTDQNDNLVSVQHLVPYRAAQELSGNLLLAEDQVGGGHFFLLKEAPNGTSQISYPGFDFLVNSKEIAVPFTGFPLHNPDNGWVLGYPMTIGLAGNQLNLQLALREYLKKSVNYEPEDYEMVLMNTWGDRGQDGKINEDFIIRELEKAEELGVSHFQMDDGWQQGLSKNSVSSEGALWDDWLPEDWLPHAERFPGGFEKVLDKAHELGIRLGLWFNPATANNFEAWEQDANTIISLHQKTGIQYFKIDGVYIPTKTAEENLFKFFDKVKEETGNKVFFNLDLTAGKRGGYFLIRHTGNLFLENRYTDWGNYYPYRTLRNVWQLSRYFPPEFLQVEFLNKWRNKDKYPENDPFAPSEYDFDYVFATSMAGQPLAWFEATGLPEEAMETGEIIQKYREIQADFHAGYIFPIGEEPSGRSWTGFHSMNPNLGEGFILVYREDNDLAEKGIHLPWMESGNYIFTKIMGEGAVFEVLVGESKTVKFQLPAPNTFQLLKYKRVSP